MALLVVLILFTATSCKDKACSHVWNGGEITTPATCKDEGVKTYTCSLCGAKKTEAVPVTSDHKFVDVETTKEPTCIEKGSKTVKCSVCGKTETEEIAALGHSLVYDNTITKSSGTGDPVSSLVAPTCKYTGKYKMKCTRTGCGFVSEETILPVDSMAHRLAKYDATAYTKASSGHEGSIKITECDDNTVSGETVTTYIDTDLAGTWDWSNAMGECTLVLEKNGSGTLIMGTYEYAMDWSVLKDETGKTYKKIGIVNKTDNTVQIYCYFAETNDNGWLGVYNSVTSITRKTET